MLALTRLPSLAVKASCDAPRGATSTGKYITINRDPYFLPSLQLLANPDTVGDRLSLSPQTC